MIPHHVYYQLAILGLLWLCVMLHDIWPSQSVVSPQPSVQPAPPQGKRKRSNEPRPFAGLTQQPHCALCEHSANHPEPQPPKRPAPMRSTNRSRVPSIPRCTVALKISHAVVTATGDTFRLELRRRCSTGGLDP